jgi:DNA-binding response OmpR family regulator
MSHPESHRPRLVVISPFDEDLISLLNIVLKNTDWVVQWWATGDDAVAMLQGHPVPVVLCDTDLPDRTWRKLLTDTKQLETPPRFVLTAVGADERLWLEALNCGVHDLITRPFDPLEVLRILGEAMAPSLRRIARNPGASGPAHVGAVHAAHLHA